MLEKINNKPTKTWKPWKPVPKKNTEQNEKLEIVNEQKKNSIYWFIINNKPNKKHHNKDKSKLKFRWLIWNRTANEELNNNKKVLNKARPKGDIRVRDNMKAES